MKKVLMITVAVICGIFIAVYIAGVVYFSNQFLPGTSINGISMDLKTADEAGKLLEDQIGSFTITVSNGDITDELTGEQAGLSYACLDNENEISDDLASQDKMKWFMYFISPQSREITSEVTLNEDTLKSVVPTLNCIASDQITAPEDAYIDYVDGEYRIEKEVTGNTLDEETFESELKTHLLALDTAYDADCYLTPEVTSDDPDLNSQIEAFKQIAEETITISNPYHEITLSGDDLKSMIKLKKGKVKVKSDKLKEYISDNITGTFYSVGATKTVTTAAGGTFSVSGGTYGYVVNPDETYTLLKKAILAGEDSVVEPAYYRSETYKTNGGLGDTYIDVNIKKQKVWLVYNGKVILKTNCVTGNVSEDNDTPKGIYWIEYKRTDYQMNQYGNGTVVDYWMCISNQTGVGLHDAQWRSKFGGKIYKTNGSHGCINLPTEAAKKIYSYAFGTMPVVVH